MKFDTGKIRLNLIPPEAIYALGQTLEYGAKKYTEHSWKNVEPDRYINALLRHSIALSQDLSAIDQESKLPHIYHVLTNAAFLVWMLEQEANHGVQPTRTTDKISREVTYPRGEPLPFTD